MGKIIKGNVNLSNLHLTELFDLSDVEVTGDFSCSKNDLTSLEGSPHTVGGNYYCHNNHLTSLEGSPHTVGGDYDCDKNPLKSLKGIPKYIGGKFFIDIRLKDNFTENYIRDLSNIQGNVRYVDNGLIAWAEWEIAPPGDY